MVKQRPNYSLKVWTMDGLSSWTVRPGLRAGVIFAVLRKDVNAEEWGDDAAWITSKAFAKFSPGLKHSDNPGIRLTRLYNPEGVRQLANPFRV